MIIKLIGREIDIIEELALQCFLILLEIAMEMYVHYDNVRMTSLQKVDKEKQNNDKRKQNAIVVMRQCIFV